MPREARPGRIVCLWFSSEGTRMGFTFPGRSARRSRAQCPRDRSSRMRHTGASCGRRPADATDETEMREAVLDARRMMLSKSVGCYLRRPAVARLRLRAVLGPSIKTSQPAS